MSLPAAAPQGTLIWQTNGTEVFAGHLAGEDGAVPQVSPQLLFVFFFFK